MPSNPQFSDSSTNSLLRVKNGLQQHFGTDFVVNEVNAEISPDRRRSDYFSDTEYNEHIQIRSAGDFRWSVNFSEINCSGQVFTAHAEVAALDRESIIRTSRCLCESLAHQLASDQLNERVDHILEQVSSDMEEICWFRKMAEEVAECRADDPLQHLCERILPQLRDLLHATTVVVLELPENENQLDAIAWHSGVANFSPDVDQLTSLVEEFGHRDSSNAVIHNSSFPVSRSGVTGLRNRNVGELVIVRIGTEIHHFGWLLALDRKPPVGDPSRSRTGDPEFGSHEGTLMETAGVLLTTHATNRDLFAEQERALFGVVKAMVNALDARDPYTRGHSQRVAQVGLRIARYLKLEDKECEDIYLTGLLHDIGKIGVADDVLLKQGPLTDEERLKIARHTVIGHSILSPVAALSHILPGVLHHHERIDGGGYPSCLVGDSIPLVGRILAVADAYDAMTTNRPYRNAMKREKAEAILRGGAGTQWDRQVIDAFFAIKDDIQAVDSADHERLATTSANPTSRVSMMQSGRFEDLGQGYPGLTDALSTCDI